MTYEVLNVLARYMISFVVHKLKYHCVENPRGIRGTHTSTHTHKTVFIHMGTQIKLIRPNSTFIVYCVHFFEILKGPPSVAIPNEKHSNKQHVHLI